MTNQQINIAIAEACGWNYLDSRTIYPRGIKDGVTLELPDYCKCLNAMREAMLTLTNKQGFGFLWHLNDMGFVGGDWELLTLDSQVLAEAFLRTLGKWEDTK
jgi:hypothetical protein